MRIEYASGRRYTGMKDVTLREEDGKLYYEGVSASDTPYGETADPITTVDLKINKYFDLRATQIKFYCTIENLFNAARPTSINPFTGKAYDPGEIYSYGFINSPDPNYNPGRYSIPRTIELGLSLKF